MHSRLPLFCSTNKIHIPHNLLAPLSTASARLGGEEGRSVLLGLSTVLAMRQSVLQVLVSVHDVLMSLQVLIGHHSGLDDLNRTIASTVSSSHLLIALLHSSQKSRVTVLLVHVVSTGTRVVTQPDSIVLHLLVCLVNLPTSLTLPKTHTSFTARISPVPFFILWSLCMKYQ